jgi:uncharacterized damage-inducible protein DinB
LYTQQALLDLHTRAHRSLRKLLEHCGTLDSVSLDRELAGFGYPSVRLQLHHVIGAEEYWMSVLRGNCQVDDNDGAYPTVAALEVYREQVARATGAYLEAMSDAELNRPRELLTWQGVKRVLVPARVMARFITHVYQHQGQVAAQCRLLGSPIPSGLDFPID